MPNPSRARAVARAAQEGRGDHRAGGGRLQPLPRLARTLPHRRGGGEVAFHLYAAYEIVRTELPARDPRGIRAVPVFLIFPLAQRFRHRVMWWDWVLALLGIATVAYMVVGGDEFIDRIDHARPTGTWSSASR